MSEKRYSVEEINKHYLELMQNHLERNGLSKDMVASTMALFRTAITVITSSLSQETEEKQLDTHVLEVVRRTNTHELLSVASTVKEAEEEARLKLKDGETFYIRTFYEGGYSPHLDRKIEPLTEKDFYEPEKDRMIQAGYGNWQHINMITDDGMEKLIAMSKAFNQLQEVRRP